MTSLVRISIRYCWLFPLVLILSGCASSGPYKLTLMAPPDVYDADGFDPFAEMAQTKPSEIESILYATDRQPLAVGDKSPYYKNETGNVLRLGEASVSIAGKDFSWEDIREITLLKGKRKKYPLVVDGVTEFGVLDRSVSPLIDGRLKDGVTDGPRKEFVAKVNAKLHRSKVKDVYIYVHGYKVVFDNPILVASELWHFLGYEGVFIAYAWPATPKVLAYIADSESAAHSSRNLRMLIQFLAEETDARRIHIVGYSAGTRVVTTALWQLALKGDDHDARELRRKLRLGRVMLMASDVDRTLAGGYVDDGMLDILDNLSIYTSTTDSALGLSRFLFGRRRLGEYFTSEDVAPEELAAVRELDELDFVDVSNAKQSGKGNGHAYFRNSPWVSSDLLMALRYDLSPGQRGLVLEPEELAWEFPPDYIDRLREAIGKADPATMEVLSEIHRERHGVAGSEN